MLKEIRIGGTVKPIWKLANEIDFDRTEEKLQKEIEETAIGKAILAEGFKLTDSDVEDEDPDANEADLTLNYHR